jgi:signal transduction histidine kinase/CheY-like chemotaxis protein/ligand-binding sensor domain-containing protein
MVPLQRPVYPRLAIRRTPVRLRASILLFVTTLTLVATAMSASTEWTPTRAFRTFSKVNWRGLPQSSVVALAQDSEGVLWLGTLDGVASFDGRTITPVPAVPGAPLRGVIAAIVPRKKGGVYVGSSEGVHLFDGQTWRLFPSKRGVAAIAEGADGTVWMATTDGVLWTLDAHGAWQRHAEVPEAVLALAGSADGAMWAATNAGGVRISDGRVVAVPGPALPGRPAAMLAASDGRIWVATAAGTVHWTQGNDGWHQADFKPWARGAFRCLAEDRRGRIWAGSYGGGVAFGNATMPWTVWDRANGPFEPGVMSILGDREGSVWFGLNAVGVAQWVGEEWSHRMMLDPENPTAHLFSAFGLNRGLEPHTLFVALFNSGGMRLSENSARVYATADGLTQDVRSLIEPERGLMIAGTRFGIFESRESGVEGRRSRVGGATFHQVLTLPGGFVMGLFQSPDGKVYAATSTQGVLQRDANGWQPVPAWNSHLDNVHVRGMTWRKNGELWIATLRGIAVFRDGAFVRHWTSGDDPAIPKSVNTVLDVSDDEVWVGGTGGVAVRRGNRWQKMTDADGVPGVTVYSLARGSDGAIWAGGSGGVGRYADGRWTTWDSRAGLLQEECNLNGLVIEDDGSVFVGTMGGLAHFDPHVKPLSPPPLKLVWRKTPPRDSSGIAHVGTADRALHLGWSAAWLGPAPVQFRVRVPRLREAWSPPMSDDHLDIENLGAGDWRAEVEARVEGSNAWSAPLTLDVAVAPFWYETVLGQVALIALLVGIGYALVRLRLRAMRRHAAMLEAIVQERTAQLAEKVELLHESEQRALAASRAKSAFLANMSHELRTPLNGVLGFAQLLARRKNRDAEDREGLDIIMKSGEHLLGLINDVLSLSKIEAGRVTMEHAPFDVAALVRDVEDVLRFRAQEKGLDLVYELDLSLPPAVTGDEGKVRQILINLVGNAVKFTERGHVTVRVRWQEDRGHFEIDDSGPGIAPSDLPRLFEPFVQTDSGVRTKEGTGLGLALSRDLARLMDGDITVESTLGKGSCFTLDIRLPAAADSSLAATDDRGRVTALAPGQGNIRILVVDDIAVNRAVLSRLLLSTGFEVREAANGEAALALWESWHPHLIWMDKWMQQGIDGLEVTRRIRSQEQATGKARVPILALSASALDQERGEILAAGCDDFVAKPFREATIFAKIREFLHVEYLYEGGASQEPAGLAGRMPADRPAGSRRSAEQPARSVLLVDDDYICRQVAGQLLREHGIAVSAATGGLEALGLMETRAFDLVLMDLHMPDMDGPETARRIKAKAGLQQLPIIAMTAESFDDAANRLAAANMDDYLGKPVEPEALAKVLERWLPAR